METVVSLQKSHKQNLDEEEESEGDICQRTGLSTIARLLKKQYRVYSGDDGFAGDISTSVCRSHRLALSIVKKLGERRVRLFLLTEIAVSFDEPGACLFSN